MTLQSTFEKTRKDVEEAVSRSMALQAVVGAGDLAVEKLRALQDEVANRLDTFDPKEFRDRAQADVKGTPDRFVEMSAKGQTALAEMLSTAFATYGDLATRGREVVERIRSQQATDDLKRQASTTASRAKATSTTARKAAGTTARSARSGATSTGSTAKSSASRAKTSGRASTTSAKRTSSSARKAGSAAAGKVGKPTKKSDG